MTKGYYFRGESISFEEAFPEIEDIKVEGTEGDLGSGFVSGKKVNLNKENIGEIGCSSFVCEEGEYALGDFISEMYNKKETFKEKIIMCKGHEKMGSGNPTRRCLNGLNIKVKIKYKKIK